MTVFLPRRDELSVMGFWLLQIYRYWFRGSVKMEPIPVDEPGSAGGIWVACILDSSRGRRRRETVAARTGRDGRGGLDERGRCWVIFGSSAAS